ncbi:DUF3892 domain-containing protein [Pelagibius marinus]|uniref:DUF3892 domain-containing protein n=1 Tax=Pelagibius marinus TaxID=2762760 RepID=UPI0029C9E9EF
MNKSDRMNPYERILRIGDGQTILGSWRKTQEEVIREIEAGVNRFYVQVNRQSVWVEIAVSQHGNRYLKTEPGGEQPNNLLSLPECRA